MLNHLQPAGDPRPPAELLATVRARDRAGAERPFVYVNMISTVDGHATLDGRTQALGSDADLQMLLELRAMADAVLIGSGTLRAEGYARLVKAPARRERRVAAGLESDPVAVLISRGLDLRWDAGLFTAPEQPVVIYTGSDAEPPATAAPVEVVRLEDPSPAAVLAHLRAERGVRALLCEGGPTLNRALLAGELVDELFLTLAPGLTGDDEALAIVAGGTLDPPVELDLQWVLEAGGELFLRYAVARTG